MIWYEIVGLTAAVFTTGAALPQVIKTLRTKKTRDISLLAYTAIVIGILLWLVYGLLIESLSIVVANFVALFLYSSILACKLKYK